MPVYEYSCPSCGVFETMQRVTDPVLRRCPKCAKTVTKLMSPSSFQFKGTGWYVTDYARKGNGSARKETCAAKEAKGKEEGSEGSSAAATEGSGKAA